VSAFGSLFSSRYLTTDVTEFPGVWFDIYTGLLVALFLGGLFVYLRRRPLSRGLTPRRHFLRNTAQSVMWIAGIGLFFCVMRFIELPYLDFRIFSYIVVLGGIAYLGYLTFFLSERYPSQVHSHRQLEADRRYRTAPKRRTQQPATAAATGRSGMQRGKRRR
jgi:hypothetical protein